MPKRLHFFHRQRHCPEVFIHLSKKNVRPVAVEHVAKAAVGLRKEGGLHQAGFIFESQKFHGIAVFGVGDFAGDQYAGHFDVSADVPCRAVLRIDL